MGNPVAKVPSVVDWCTWAHAQGLNVYAVIDVVQDKSPRWWRTDGPRELNLFADRTQDPQALEIAPRLRQIAASESAMAQTARLIGEQSSEQPDAFLVASALSLDPLCARLVRRFDVLADNVEMLLRIWDARVLLTLRHAVSAPTANALLAFGVQALVSDRRGAHVAVDLCDATTDPLLTTPVPLQAAEVDALVNLAQPDALLAMVREQDENLLQDVPDAQRHGLAEQQLGECLARRFLSPRDQALALCLAIEHGPQWWEAAEWSGCLQQACETTLWDACQNRLETGA